MSNRLQFRPAVFDETAIKAHLVTADKAKAGRKVQNISPVINEPVINKASIFGHMDVSESGGLNRLVRGLHEPILCGRLDCGLEALEG